MSNGQIIIEPFDRNSLKSIEKGIILANLKLTPDCDGQVIRINIPPATEERRTELIKDVKGICEEGKIAIRNVRRDTMERIKKEEKDKKISKDEHKNYQVSQLK